MKIFNSIGHLFAWVASKIVSGSATVAQDASAVGSAASSPVASALASVGGTKAQQAQSDIEAIAGCVVASAASVGSAVVAGGLNVTLDEAAAAAVGRLVSTIGDLFGKATPSPSNPAPTTGTAAA